MMTYGNVHRQFLQLMIQHRSLEEAEAVKLMKSCCKDHGERVPQLDVFIQQLNKELEGVELSVRSTVEERKDSDYPCLVLVNLMAGETTRTLSTFSKNELSFVRLLVSEIIALEAGELPMNTAINLGLQLSQKLRVSCCEKLIERMVAEKWLLLTEYPGRGECVSLSCLIVAELNTYLEETHKDRNLKCFFCTKVTLKGYQCEKCGVAVHRDCAWKYWETSKKKNACPGDRCSAFLGPATPDTQTKKKRVSPDEREESGEEEEEEIQAEEEEEEEEAEEEEEEEEKVVVVQRRRKRRI